MARLAHRSLEAVAERRFADAEALLATGKNAHANGAQYLAGYVIEILLKARLLERYPSLSRLGSRDKISAAEQRIWGLIWRSHELDDMLTQLPELEAALAKKSQYANVDYLQQLKAVCAAWSIEMRYSTQTSTAADARQMIDRVRVLKELLK